MRGSLVVAKDLTATEETIAELAASGLTNRAIAERIFVSPKTVESTWRASTGSSPSAPARKLGLAMAERERAVET